MTRRNKKKKTMKTNLICIAYSIIFGIPVGYILEYIKNENIKTAVFMFFSMSVVLLAMYLDSKGSTTSYKNISFNEEERKEYDKFLEQIKKIY